MSHQTLKSKIKEQVENKVNPILKEKYQEGIAIKLFKSSSKVIRDSIDEVTKSYYINHSQETKENFIKEIAHRFWNGRIRFKKDLKVKISQDWINYFLEK